MLDLLVMALATWRLSFLIVREDGPLDVFRRIRSKVGIIHHDDGSIASIPERQMAKLFGCLNCISLWVALMVWIVWQFLPPAIWIVSLSGLAILLDGICGIIRERQQGDG